jgi:hypothetical protein
MFTRLLLWMPTSLAPADRLGEKRAAGRRRAAQELPAGSMAQPAETPGKGALQMTHGSAFLFVF